MARVLVIYYRAPQDKWLPTYIHSLESLRRYSDHECFYLNTARRRVPSHIRSLTPDLVVFHYTLTLRRQWPEEFAAILDRVAFVRDLDCPKVVIAQDEQVRMDLLNQFTNDFGITRIFSPAPAATWTRVYRDVDLDKVRITPILNGYIDEVTLRRIEKRAKRHHGRPIDIGYRSWYTQPFYGRHGQLKREIGRAFAERAPDFGLAVDISAEYKDALWGNRWIDFLLDCKYTIGIEGGCSVFDWDGSVAERTREYVQAHPDAAFTEIEAACFPGLDGGFQFYSLSPRQLESVMTRTCQVLVEGEYAGILTSGRHYIELKRDFSNLDEVLEAIKRDDLRQQMVDTAFDEIVGSGKYTFRVFAKLVLEESLSDGNARSQVTVRARRRMPMRLLRDRIDEALWNLASLALRATRSSMRALASAILGEERLVRVLDGVRGRKSR